MRFQPLFGSLMVMAGILLVACQPFGRSPELVTTAVTGTTIPRATGTPRQIVPTRAYIPEQSTANSILPESSDRWTPQPILGGLPATQQTAQVVVCSPLAGIGLDELPSIISSPYDPPPAGKEDRHHGVDFSYYRRGEQSSIQGTGVQAVLPGIIAMALNDSYPYGNVVIVESNPNILPASIFKDLDIRNEESLYTLYAHLEEGPEFQVGQLVDACQPIGSVGKSGNAGVAHLHLETRLGPAGASFYQMGYYLPQSTDIEKENYLRWRISGDFRHFNPMTLLSVSDGP
jgi:murein DD-endopeptidase MepM/ murein hydrolase activator NlpD